MKRALLSIALVAACAVAASAARPESPDNFSVKFTVVDGQPKVLVTLTAPSYDVEGNPLESLDRIEVTRCNWNTWELDVEAAVIEGIAPGETVTVEDTASYNIGEEWDYDAKAYVGDDSSYAAMCYATLGINPAKIEDLTAVSSHGDAPVTIRFTVPSLDSDGNELTSVSRVDIQRGFGSSSPVIHSFECPVPGSSLEFVDDDAEALVSGSNYYWRVTVQTPYGSSVAQVSANLIIDVPSTPREITADLSDPSKVTVAWMPVTLGKSGGWIDPEAVVYDVYRCVDGEEEWLLASGLSCTYCEDMMEGISSPVSLRYKVYAHYEGEEYTSAAGTGMAVVCGPATPAPYAESFGVISTEGLKNPDNFWNFDTYWKLKDSERVMADGAKKYYYSRHEESTNDCFATAFDVDWTSSGTTAEFSSHWISLDGLKYPVLKFWMMQCAGAGSVLTVCALTPETETVLAELPVANEECTLPEWKEREIRLDGIEGSWVKLVFKALAADTVSPVSIDDVSVEEGVPTGVSETEAGCIATEYYDLSGRKVSNPSDGIFIKVERDSNGSRLTKKVVL